MKIKFILLIVLILAFSGCPDPVTDGGKWIKGLDDLIVGQGSGYGELNYSFSATDPEAASYTLYYIKGTIGYAPTIIANGTEINVQPAASGSPGIISGLEDETSYSIVVVARKGKMETISDVRQAETKLLLKPLNGDITIKLPDSVSAGNVFTTMILTADYNGDEDVTYQWNKDGEAIDGKTEKNFTPDEAGEYTVTVSVQGFEDKESIAITISTFVPVTEITGITEKIQLGEPSIIGGIVNPSNASFNDIIWVISANNANSSAIIDASGKLIADNYGIITLTATVKNGLAWGSNFMQDYNTRVATFVELGITLEDDDFGIGDVGKAVISSLSSSVILSSTNPTVVLDISADAASLELNSINWYLGNIPLASNSALYTLEYAAFNNPGSYTLTIEFIKDSKRWSGSFNFEVN